MPVWRNLAAQARAIPGGTGMLGTDDPLIPSDGEGPARDTQLAAFRLGAAAVTVGEFGEFVAATGYVTEAQRRGSSFVFRGQCAADAQDLGGLFGAPWWREIKGACWTNPTGKASPNTGDPSMPVTHVSFNDARAYAAAVGGRLPSEAEWEHAARAGQGDVRYPWGDDDPQEGGGDLCNIWHGAFPDAPQPGGFGPVPAISYAPNAFGLFNMCGNVWEWTGDVFHNGIGPDPNRQVLKGGSFLCHPSYCFRYRIAARIGAGRGTTTSHQGFRVAFDDPNPMEH
jgi:formylglycine-generating enzyme